MMTITSHPFFSASATPRRWQVQSLPWSGSTWRMPVTTKTWAPGEANWMHTAWTPKTDIVEHEDVYMLRVDLPGFSQEAIDLNFQDGVLTLKGERQEDQDTQHRYHRRERAHGTFMRHFTFGKRVDAEQIAASYQNGVLEIRFPKTVAATTKKIAVQAS